MFGRPIVACRICRGDRLLEVFDLGEHALSSRFPTAEEKAVPRGPLTLLQCVDCGLVQLRHDFEQDELYRHDYGYRSGINEAMVRHLAALAEDVAGRAQLNATDLVVDIGSNDSTLLRGYPVAGLARLGIDPTSAQFRAFYPPDIVAIADYFNAQTFDTAAAGAKAKAITSVAMFYDLHDPNTFVADVAHALHPDGIWVFEQSYLGLMLDRTSFDTICHEHIEYYALAPIERLLGANGLRVFDVQLNDVNGGSFRLYACHQGAKFSSAAAVDALRRQESERGLATAAPLIAFRKRCEARRAHLIALLDDMRAADKTVLGYGASTKGNTLMQFCGIGSERLPAIADRNPQKWGRRTPGTNIPIISEEEARTRRPDVFLALPWHFREGFLERERAYLESGGRMIFPLPEVEVI